MNEFEAWIQSVRDAIEQVGPPPEPHWVDEVGWLHGPSEETILAYTNKTNSFRLKTVTADSSTPLEQEVFNDWHPSYGKEAE